MMTAGSEVTPDVRFRLSLENGGVRFLRRLSYADVNLDCPVIFGTEGGSFTIGPSVQLDCGEIQPLADTIQIRSETSSGDEGPDVLLLAENYRSAGSPPQINLRGSSDEVGVYWPEVAFPWVDYRLSSRPASEVDDEELTEALKYFSRILTFFRSYGYGGLGRRTGAINEAAVGESEMAADLLDFLLEDGLIRQEGQFFQLDSDRLDAHGITWPDVKNRSMSEGMQSLLRDFIRSRT